MMSILQQLPNQSTILQLNPFFRTVISLIISSSWHMKSLFEKKKTLSAKANLQSKNCHFYSSPIIYKVNIFLHNEYCKTIIIILCTGFYIHIYIFLALTLISSLVEFFTCIATFMRTWCGLAWWFYCGL